LAISKNFCGNPLLTVVLVICTGIIGADDFMSRRRIDERYLSTCSLRALSWITVIIRAKRGRPRRDITKRGNGYAS